MKDIYQRIADIHYDHAIEEHGSFYRCSCGQQFTYKCDHDGHFADVLVEELGLHKVSKPEYPTIRDAGVVIAPAGPRVTQWRTDWVRDD